MPKGLLHVYQPTVAKKSPYSLNCNPRHSAVASGAHLSTFSWYFSPFFCPAPAHEAYTYSLNILCSTCALCLENSFFRSFFRPQMSTSPEAFSNLLLFHHCYSIQFYCLCKIHDSLKSSFVFLIVV